MKKHKTSNIEEAAYYAVKGNRYRLTRVNDVSVWTFDDTDSLRKNHRQFWGGVSEVNLHKWLSIRNLMVRELPLPVEAAEKPKTRTFNTDWRPSKGGTYWYVTEKGTLDSRVYGDADCHKKCFDTGNVFRTEIEGYNYLLGK